MLKNTLINRAATKKIAIALSDLNERVVYVGGAVVSLYIDDTAADDVRPTKDIDISMKITSLAELEDIRQQLTDKGFYQSHEDDVVCRFRFDDLIVDVMSTHSVGWAPANPWFEPGFKNLISFKIDNEVINCLSLPYYLATKFTAFYNRGSKDPRTSQDFEDIVYILNYTSNVKVQVTEADKDVREYLLDCFRDILEDSVKQEAIMGNLFYENQEFRYRKIINELKEITNGV
ncbi:MAG TPA: nucleotidyl transferase AbiEii/AbiGii toxin family protein [Niabella sp.]|nr:nucleotidyl transferase AbiEii/AbiGii toxin family protein [Niabella sp.]